jgi:hypothetical protein
MANTFAVSRAQLIYAVCLPLAVLLGYILADPMDLQGLAVVVLVFSVLAVPLLMRWYHPLLICTWNASISPVFVPGRPDLWMLIAMAGLLLAILNRATNPEFRFISVSAIDRPLLCIGAVVLMTAFLRGGIGLHALGSDRIGGRNYFYALVAVAGYFALTSQRIPLGRAQVATAAFLLSGLTGLAANLIFVAGPAFDFLYYIFPPLLAREQADSQFIIAPVMVRFAGLYFAAPALYSWLLARYGLRGAFDWHKPWRLLLMLAAFMGCLLSGYRSAFALLGLTIAIQMFCERLYRPRVLVLTATAFIVIGAIMLPVADRLPMVVQRTLSFLPIDFNPIARNSAQASTDWRLEMWRDVLPDVPKYLLLGKGYGFDTGDLQFAVQGSVGSYGGAMLAGDYHSGPLSLAIPFGLWGILAFLWFLGATLKYLYHQLHHGNPALRQINAFFFSFFLARIFYFIFVFGGFSIDLHLFTGLAGLAVCLNGASTTEARETAPEEQSELPEQEEFAPAYLRERVKWVK